jgi:hypothetical protein
MDEFSIKAIKYVGAARGETVSEVIAGAIGTEIDGYPDLARARDQQCWQDEQDEERARLQREWQSEQRAQRSRNRGRS